MSLSRKYILAVIVLMGGVLFLGGLSVWNLTALYHAARGASAEYEAMDHATAAVNQLTWLRDVYAGPDALTYRDDRFFTAVRREIENVLRLTDLAASIDDGDGPKEVDLARQAADRITAANQKALDPASNNLPALKATAAELDAARTALIDLSNTVPASARRHVTGAADRLYSRLLWTVFWLVVVLGVSGFVHASQYRLLVRPLRVLRDDLRQSAANNFRERVRPAGEAEFAEVAGLFNGLARELAELYRTLEEKVIARSLELVRSERLASVGFLAAGVAHEINNPLSVISGYAELAAKGIKRVLNGGGAVVTEEEAAAEAEALAAALEAQTIIRDEAFRCKEITSRLLTLSRGGADGRQPLRLDEVARQVSVLVHGLKQYRDRRVTVELAPDEPLDVVANPVEMKQVLLNLTVNALEATPAQQGEVRIGGRREGDWVSVSVSDNGKGMSADTLKNVFEPFFTAKRGTGEPGTGLGLSVTHAIVENHGGRVRAESGGPGRGSRFTVQLPVHRVAPVPAMAN